MAVMTVQRALNELKIVEDRLHKRLSQFTIIGTKKNSESRVSETREDVAEFKVRATSVLNHVDVLIIHQQNLKR